MTREEAFDQLNEMGVVKARAHYHGGHDEGYVDEILLYGPDGSLIEPQPDLYDESVRLAEALEQPVEEHLGHAWYDGVDDRAGYVYWHVPERKVTIEHSEMEWKIYDEVEV